MTAEYGTEQESFWAGDFGREYTDRNAGRGWVASNVALFSRILARTEGVSSVLELGANRGLNLEAIRTLLPKARLTGVEINAAAVALLQSVEGVDAIHGSILDYVNTTTFDLTFTKTVLIHINPTDLPRVYDTLVRNSNRYIAIVEYYSPTATEVTYRGHTSKLFKRDFAGELLERNPTIKLVDYGFVYHRDPNFPQDDVNWFLLEKR